MPKATVASDAVTMMCLMVFIIFSLNRVPSCFLV
jgi:hypothetical protein